MTNEVDGIQLLRSKRSPEVLISVAELAGWWRPEAWFLLWLALIILYYGLHFIIEKQEKHFITIPLIQSLPNFSILSSFAMSGGFQPSNRFNNLMETALVISSYLGITYISSGIYIFLLPCSVGESRGERTLPLGSLLEKKTCFLPTPIHFEHFQASLFQDLIDWPQRPVLWDLSNHLRVYFPGSCQSFEKMATTTNSQLLAWRLCVPPPRMADGFRWDHNLFVLTLGQRYVCM